VDAHKIVLASNSPYFRAIFTNFEESNKYQVTIRQLNSSALIFLKDLICTAHNIVTEENVQVYI